MHDLKLGYPDEWKSFMQRRAVFMERLPRLVGVANKSFMRGFDADVADRVIFSLVFMAWEDFEDIVVLAVNGRGFGCQKVLRGMYERLVVAAHLHAHPTEVERFLDWHYIADYKFAKSVNDSFGHEAISEAQLDGKKAARDAVKEKFTRTCTVKGCGKTVEAFSWSNLDIVAMSKQRQHLGEVASIAYYAPMAHTHATVQSILSHLDETGFMGNVDRSRNAVDQALSVAHNLTIQNFAVQMEHFPDLGGVIEADMAVCINDFGDTWTSPGGPRGETGETPPE